MPKNKPDKKKNMLGPISEDSRKYTKNLLYIYISLGL